MATLVNKLDPRVSSETPTPEDPSSRSPSSEIKESEPSDTEYLGWGLKTADPGPDKIYPSDKLGEVIDIDPKLDLEQCEALYKVVERNQAAFGFDGRLGHLNSEVHIELAPGMKPISMPPYYASPAK